MKLYTFEPENMNEINLEWIEKTKRFGIYFDEKESGWYFVERMQETEDENCGYIDKETLEKIYIKIGKILGK